MSSSIASMTRLGGRRTTTFTASRMSSSFKLETMMASSSTSRTLATLSSVSSSSLSTISCDSKLRSSSGNSRWRYRDPASGSSCFRRYTTSPIASSSEGRAGAGDLSIAGGKDCQFKINHSSSLPSTLTIGILRETYDKWERRAPLTPQHVQDLLAKHNNTNDVVGEGTASSSLLQVLVQPSTNRAFSNKEYQNAGATITNDLSNADIILGVKRPSEQSMAAENGNALIDDKIYLFFSHVIKGQVDNMDLLQTILDKNITLIDYECIVEEEDIESKRSKRMVAFGKYAGMAGMMDCFQPLGRRLLWKSSDSSNDSSIGGGYSTPFLNCPSTILHTNLNEMKRSMKLLSERIEHDDGLPYSEMKGLEPIVFVMTGKGGNVYNGVREIFEMLPYESISPNDLPQLYNEYGTNNSNYYYNNKVYSVELDIDDIYQRKEEIGYAQQNVTDLLFDRDHFYENPSEYHSTFASNILPYTNVLVNCIYWDHRFPRLITKNDMLELYQAGNERLMVVADISCDVNGSIEFLEKTTTIDKPYYTYDPILQKVTSNDIEDYGITMLGVDILPSEIPIESSIHFSKSVSKLITEFVENKQVVSSRASASAAVHDEGITATIDVSQLSPRLVSTDLRLAVIPSIEAFSASHPTSFFLQLRFFSFFMCCPGGCMYHNS